MPYWCFHCGQEGSTPSDIVHTEKCRRQVSICVGQQKVETQWCKACGSYFPVDDSIPDCLHCHKDLEIVYR